MKYFIDALKKYAVFKGRARRAEFWYFILFYIIGAIIIGIISNIIFINANKFGNILSQIYYLALFIPTLTVASRRMHDIGKNNWIVLLLGAISLFSMINEIFLFATSSMFLKSLSLITLIFVIWFVVLACIKSTPGDNKFGPNPKGIQTDTLPVVPTGTSVQNPPQPEQPTNTQ